MNATLNGKWSYRSFPHVLIVLRNGQTDGDPELAALWSPLGKLEVTTGETDERAETLRFASAIALKAWGAYLFPSSELNYYCSISEKAI